MNFFEIELLGALGLGCHFFITCETSLRLCLATLRVRTNPFEFFRQSLGELGVLFALHFESFRLLFKVGRVVALVGIQTAAVDFRDPLRNVVEEIPIVRDGNDRTRVLGEMLFQPQHALGVEVVCWFVEKEKVGLLEQKLAERHAALLAPRQDVDSGVGRRAPQRVHRLFEL